MISTGRYSSSHPLHRYSPRDHHKSSD